MVKFLINKPIAVTMTFLAIIVLGIVATMFLPVSLMPEVDIPKITVQLSQKNLSAREIENTITKPLRQQLMQVAHLKDIKSQSRDGSAIIELDFNYGINIDFVFIEVNEKIDRAMGSFPTDVERPKVIKASATDIPVFYLNLTIRSEAGNRRPETGGQDGESGEREEAGGMVQRAWSGKRRLDSDSYQNENQKSKIRNQNSEIHTPEPVTSNQQPVTSNQQPATRNTKHPTSELFPVTTAFIELSNFADQVIKKRIEQLPEVALADISGRVYTELLILPDLEKLQAVKITLEDIKSTLNANNINLGNLLIKDGQYQYNIRVGNKLQSKEDIANLYIKKEGRLYQLKDFAEIIEHPQKRKGLVVSDGKDAICLAIIKQSDARMRDLEKQLNNLISYLKTDYPDIEFTVTRDQTKLLDYSIQNLKQSLLLGAFLAFIIMFFFLKDFKSPILIGISIPVSLVISLLFFHIFSISINIISLSGLILGIGMMIDNSIIVIDNITQYRERRFDLTQSCVAGTNEVFRPMLSSVLTTCAVFIPLIFLGGISGALFYDQAIAVSIGLFVSLMVSLTLLPVYYRVFYKRWPSNKKNDLLVKLNKLDYESLYEKGLRFTLKNQKLVWLFVFFMVAGGVLLFIHLDKNKFPPLASTETLLRIDWNERITVDENNRRVQSLVEEENENISQKTVFIGEQQFLLEHNMPNSGSYALVYLNARTKDALADLTSVITQNIQANYPAAIYSFKETGNVFNLIFSDNEPPLEARLKALKNYGPKQNEKLKECIEQLSNAFPLFEIPSVSWQEQLVLCTDPELLAIYNIDFQEVFDKLKTSFRENQVMLIAENQEFIPVVLGEKPKQLNEIIKTTFVANRNGEFIRLSSLLKQKNTTDLKTIVAGREGEYYPVPLRINNQKVPEAKEKINDLLQQNPNYEASFTGSWFTNRKLIKDIALILMISLILLYFILASQFESLVLPLIVLLEVPIDISGALLFLKIFGSDINLMAMIGIVVMSGIIINDSILKIDTINKTIAAGNGLIRSIIIAGQRRLKPILMTSLTTILALLPFLFTKGMGADLQRPLAYTVIGGMFIGTLVSLYFVPLCYYYLKRRKSK